MTLDTRFYILDRVDHREVFTECQRLLGQYDQDRRGPGQQKWSDNGKCISNDPMQGLPGWLMLDYRPGRQYRTAADAAIHEHCNHPTSEYHTDEWPDCTETEHDPVCWLEVSIDTAYGYRGPEGMRCGDLHARFVAELGRWCDERGLAWKWLNEFTGDVHEGYEQLISLATSGFEASAWFQTNVAPLIAAEATQGGESK